MRSCSWSARGTGAPIPSAKPKYIVFAEGTEDEMCFGTYGLVVDD